MIFVDTSFLVAWMVNRDRHHDAAVELFQQVAERRVLTTNHVRGETWTWLRRRTQHERAVEFIDSVGGDNHRIQVSRPSEEIEDEALAWLRTHDEREYSFVDATSFVYMRSRGITEALAFDGDFAAAGFIELRP